VFHFVSIVLENWRKSTEFSNKIFTSARNGELIMWDISRAGSAKLGLSHCSALLRSLTFRLEQRTKHHLRSINQLAISYSVHHYCVTGSADGDLRIWVRLSTIAFINFQTRDRIYETCQNHLCAYITQRPCAVSPFLQAYGSPSKLSSAWTMAVYTGILFFITIQPAPTPKC